MVREVCRRLAHARKWLISRERAQAMASRQLASVGSETTVGRASRRNHVGFDLWDGANLCRTLRMGGRFGIPKRQVSEGGVQRLWETEDPSRTFFIAVNFATLGSVKTPT